MEGKIRPTVSPLELKEEAAIANARELSIQDRASSPDEGGDFSLGSVLHQLVRAGELVSPWWSPQRDLDLRNFWKSSGHLSGAMRAVSNKISTISYRVDPADRSIASQVRSAQEAEKRLRETPEYGKGWGHWLPKFLEDLLGTDNGAFAEVIGAGRANGPIIGAPVSIAHLDSCKCSRTSNPEFPVIYTDTDGKRYRLHYTRVIMASLMPSADVEMNDVGFSAVSSCVDIAQSLIDIVRYKAEKMGSRPARGIVLGKKGIKPEEILYAFYLANEQMSNRGLKNYAQLVVIAPKDGRGEIDLDVVDLAKLPDGFDEKESTELAMFAIALGFGVDARELWPSSVSGATKADAMIQHLKARGKGPGHIMSLIEHQINQKFLPETLTFRFDWQDDEQDMLRAEIRDQRSQRHERDVLYGGLDPRTVREQMLEDGDISEAQFVALELEDGRLNDGTPVLALFFSQDSYIKGLLSSVPIKYLDYDSKMVTEDEQSAAIASLNSAIKNVYQELVATGWSTKKAKARQALAALEFLKKKWVGEEEEEENVSPGKTDSKPGPKPTMTASDREESRNEDDYRGDSEAEIVRRLT